MAIKTMQQVRAEDVERTLSEALGSHYRVKIVSSSKLKVGRTGVIPANLTLSHTNGGTTFKVQTTGLILSRLAQMTSIYPSVRRALEEAYSNGRPEANSVPSTPSSSSDEAVHE